MNEQIDRHFEWIAENPRYGYLIAGGILLLWLNMRVEMDLRAEPVGMVLGARHFRRKGVAYLCGRIAGHRPGRCGVPLFCHGVGNEKRNAL